MRLCVFFPHELSCSYFVGIHPHLFIVGLSSLLGSPFLTLRSSSEEDIVHQCVLQQGHEDKDEAAHEVHVNGLDIGDFGEGFSQVGVDGSHGEHRSDSWWRETLKSVLLPKYKTEYKTNKVSALF